MKRIFSVLIVIIIVLQLFHATWIFAEEDRVPIDLAPIVKTEWCIVALWNMQSFSRKM